MQFELTSTSLSLLFIILMISFFFFYMWWRFHLPYSDTALASKTLLDGVNSAVLVLSNNNQVLYLNPSAEKIFGIRTQQAKRQPVEHFFRNLMPFLQNEPSLSADTQPRLMQLALEDGLVVFDVQVTALMDRLHRVNGKMVVLEDVTHHVQTELANREAKYAIRRSEETYRQLVENINGILYTLNRDGLFTYISQTISGYAKTSPQDLIGQHYRHLLDLEDGAFLDAIFQRCLAGGKEAFEFRVDNNEGSARVLLASQQPLLQDGQVIGVQGIATDITEQVQAQETLERRASQLATVNEIGEKIASLMDLDKVLDNATHLIQTNFGYYHVAFFLPDPQTNDLVMSSASGAFSSIFPENHRLKFGQGMVGWAAEHHAMLLASDVRQEPRYTNFFPDQIQTCSELSIPVMLSDELAGVLDIQSPLFNAFDENDVRLMKTIADQIAIAIENARLFNETVNQLQKTERKENMLRIQRDLVIAISSATKTEDVFSITLQTLTTALKVQRAAIYLVDRASGCLKAVTTMGASPNSAGSPASTGQSLIEWVAHSGKPVQIGGSSSAPVKLIVASDVRSQICAPLSAGSETIGVINLESSEDNYFNSDDLRLLVILANNMSILIERAELFREVEGARAELETRASALEAANERLRELDRLKSQFLANITHELRTPLTSVIGFSEILIDNLAGPLNADQEECIQNIHKSGKHLLALINDLLDLSKMEAGRMTINSSSFSVSAVFNELRLIFQPMAEKKAQLLNFEVAPDLPLLTGDRMRIKQVFINLLSNANKFTPKGGHIHASCELETNGSLLFCVSDDGIGIRAEHQDLIFEEFRQVDGSLTREAAGTGLGLAISKRIILLHHGEIWVDSALGQGAHFRIRLPVDYAPADVI